ncbi:dynein assembly factor 1, axonemal homolog [Orussus abietinus]|uniref:dynein assembly factor 1, axonemal homolog n=1 Tax=Orussus abietinus TaxID=222816 RepID=UPI000C7161C0|nr:dynein assembly factor 1, axonemal homolog [Orussus abietinus]
MDGLTVFEKGPIHDESDIHICDSDTAVSSGTKEVDNTEAESCSTGTSISEVQTLRVDEDEEGLPAELDAESLQIGRKAPYLKSYDPLNFPEDEPVVKSEEFVQFAAKMKFFGMEKSSEELRISEYFHDNLGDVDEERSFFKDAESLDKVFEDEIHWNFPEEMRALSINCEANEESLREDLSFFENFGKLEQEENEVTSIEADKQEIADEERELPLNDADRLENKKEDTEEELKQTKVFPIYCEINEDIDGNKREDDWKIVLQNMRTLEDVGEEIQRRKREGRCEDIEQELRNIEKEISKRDDEQDTLKEELEELSKLAEEQGEESEMKVQEKLKIIADGKERIEREKKEALEDLELKFAEVEEMMARQKKEEDVSSMRNSVEEEEIKSDNLNIEEIEDAHVEFPRTKTEITEEFRRKAKKSDNHQDEKKDEEMNLRLQGKEINFSVSNSVNIDIFPDNYRIPEMKEEVDAEDEKTGEKNSAKFEERVPEETENHDGEDVDTDLNDLFSENKSKEEERVYVDDKVYEFDEKKHGVRMTEKFIKKHCKEQKLYQTPRLNDVLYLHYKGFSYIENLKEYTGLKCLWLENNGILEIANLGNQTDLRCLFLHSNLISKIENLECLAKLDSLNLSHNMIRKIENLDSLKELKTLNLSHNYLQNSNDLEHLRTLDNLSILDLSHNRIDTFDVVEILGDMKSLRVVVLTGNPVLKNIKMYRKTMTLKCKNLQYLDERPIFPRDRACAEAWFRGGPDEELAERQKWIQAEQKKINDSVMAIINKRKKVEQAQISQKEGSSTEYKNEAEEIITTSSELLSLEKKKSAVSSSSSSEEENSEDEKDSFDKNNSEDDFKKEATKDSDEILLPWKTQNRKINEPTRLVEEISISEGYHVGDAKRKGLGRRILESRQSEDDLPGDCIVNRELADYEKLVSTYKEEIESPKSAKHAKEDEVSVLATEKCCFTELFDIEECTKDVHNEEKEKLDKLMMENRRIEDYSAEDYEKLIKAYQCERILSPRPWKNVEDSEETSGAVLEVAGKCNFLGDTADLSEYVKPCKRNEEISEARETSEELANEDMKHPVSSQLSKIRKEMKTFCADMDKFVEENNITYKHGKVDRFWGAKDQAKENSKTDLSESEGGSNVDCAMIPLSEKDNSTEEKEEVPALDSTPFNERRAENFPTLVEEVQEEPTKTSPDPEEDELLDTEPICEFFKIFEGINNQSESPERVLASKKSSSSPDIEGLIKTMDSLCLDKSEETSPKQAGKRLREEDISEISRKKSLMEEINVEEKTPSPRTISQVSERSRLHSIRQTKKMSKNSPLIDSLKATASMRPKSDAKTLASLLKNTDVTEITIKGMNFKEFLDYVDEKENRKKLPIDPEYLKYEVRKDASPRETEETTSKVDDKHLIEEIPIGSGGDKVDKPAEVILVHQEEMDEALKARITRNINKPKSMEEMERGRKSAKGLMEVSRKAMAEGRLPDNHSEETEIMPMTKLFGSQGGKKKSAEEVKNVRKDNDNEEQTAIRKVTKTLEMQMAQGN